MLTTFNTSARMGTSGAMQNPSERVRNRTTEEYSISLLALMLTASLEMVVFASEE